MSMSKEKSYKRKTGSQSVEDSESTQEFKLFQQW